MQLGAIFLILQNRRQRKLTINWHMTIKQVFKTQTKTGL